MAETLFWKAEYHDRCSSQTVRYYFACVGDIGLGPVDVQHVKSSGTEYAADYLKLPFIGAVGNRARKLCKSLLRDVVFGRSEASGHNHDVVSHEFRFKPLNYDVMIVPDGKHTCYLYA